MKVKNINGTSANTCKCGSWLNHWMQYSRKPLPAYCSEVTCSQKPEVGAHVQMDSAFDRIWYIVPLCKSHNAKYGESLNISIDATLVLANVADTCGK